MGHRFGLHLEVPGLTPSSSTSTVDADLHPEGVRLAPSSSTTMLDASEDTGVDGGDWQFSSAEQIICGEWH